MEKHNVQGDSSWLWALSIDAKEAGVGGSENDNKLDSLQPFLVINLCYILDIHMCYTEIR